MITETSWGHFATGVYNQCMCDIYIYMFKEFVSAGIGTGQAPRVPDIVIIEL